MLAVSVFAVIGGGHENDVLPLIDLVKEAPIGHSVAPSPRVPILGTAVIWSAVIPAKAGIHSATIALQLCTSPSGLELLGSVESNLPMGSRFRGNDRCFRGNDCLHRPA